MVALDVGDIQALILRNYLLPFQRHFVLQVRNGGAARRCLDKLLCGDSNIQITTAAPQVEKPSYALSVLFTYEGLKALGVSAASLASFPEEFVRGAGHPLTADRVGYSGESDPANWLPGLAWKNGQPADAHIVLILIAKDKPTREARAGALESLLLAEDGVGLLSKKDGDPLPEGRVHFGYTDGISHPHIEGGPPSDLPAPLPPAPPIAPPGEFLLGYKSQYDAYSYPVPVPEKTLGFNGCFAAYGILRQDVDAFENFLKQAAKETGKSEEWIAAKMCGRWRNGVPLALSPETDSPDPPIAKDSNQFDYSDDPRGLKCPIGSHIRRVNPRSSADVPGNAGYLHRLIRRGIPYGPPYDPNNPNDGEERGLLGMFLCVSLKDQYEFVMKEWINGDAFGENGDLDPLVGGNSSGTRSFRIPVADGKAIRLRGLVNFITTRGSAYCFLPSMSALRSLASI